MYLLGVLGVVYGIGAMFVIFLGMYLFAHTLADKPSQAIKTLPRLIIYTLLGAIIWPYMLIVCSEFREIVVEQGRYYIMFGYLFSVIMTPAYPWIWIWYLSFCLCWFLLESYHNKILKKILKQV